MWSQMVPSSFLIFLLDITQLDVIVVDSNYINITTTEMIVLPNITSNMSTDEPTATATCAGK